MKVIFMEKIETEAATLDRVKDYLQAKLDDEKHRENSEYLPLRQNSFARQAFIRAMLQDINSGVLR